jgi:hypothetical protein
LLSFRKSITVQNIRKQHEMAALEHFERRQRGVTGAEKSKSAKVNVECYVAYANIYRSPSSPSATQVHNT